MVNALPLVVQLLRCPLTAAAYMCVLVQILSVRTHGETGSHLPDEVMQPGLIRQLRSSSSSSLGSISSSCKSSTSKCTVSRAGSSSALDSAGSNEATEAAALCPSAYEYYVHYRLTNRRLDCWLRFSDLLPVNARGQVLLPTGFDQHGTSRQTSPTAGAAGTEAADAAALEGMRDHATAEAARKEEHMPKRMKLSHECPITSDGAVASVGSAVAGLAEVSMAASLPAAAPAAGERDAADDCAAAAAAWKRLESERSAEAEELKALLFDPSLVFSDVRRFEFLY